MEVEDTSCQCTLIHALTPPDAGRAVTTDMIKIIIAIIKH